MLGVNVVNNLIDILFVGYIQHYTLGPTAVLLNYSLGFIQHGQSSAGNDNLRASVGQIDADASANACSPACYDCNLILQLFTHGYRPFL
ncbi:hypothetical protein D3C71_1737100 [compost metagenome]